MNVLELTPQQLRRAADLQDKILSLQKELSKLLGESPVVTTTAPATKAAPKRKISAAGLAAISRAAKARWARERAKAAAGKPVKRNISQAARQKMAEAARARWARVKAGQ